MKIVVKVGTQSILAEDGTPLESVLQGLVGQIASLVREGHHVILVSSGAVGSGRRVAQSFLKSSYGSSIGEKQVLASLGQPALMSLYAHLFRQHDLLVSQLLLTKQDFHTRQHYLNISRLLDEILRQKAIIPIINENDTVAIEELMFTDNDELSGLIAAQINADKLIILSNVLGVFTGNPAHEASELIPTLRLKLDGQKYRALKVRMGEAVWISKIRVAHRLSNLGITTHIAAMKEPNVVVRLVAGEALGTTISPHKKASSIKRWMAHHTGQNAGAIFLNECLYALLKRINRVMSLLPVGIDRVQGTFQKGDPVDVFGPDGQKIGLGIARYDAEKLKDYCGLKNKPPSFTMIIFILMRACDHDRKHPLKLRTC